MVLDHPDQISRADASDMLGAIASMSRMLTEGWEAGGGLVLPRVPQAVAVCGLGGSAIGGDLLAVLLEASSPAPVLTIRAEALPAFAGPQTLVFLCSYSGDTEETLAAYEEARRAGAMVVAVTSGGRLADLARAQRVPLALVRAGLQPRAALPLLLLPMLRVAASCGLTGAGEREVREAAGLLAGLVSRWGPHVSSAGNPAKALAAALHGVMPAVYASSPRLEPVARRWKTQFNENSKRFGVFNAFPELVHNEIVGWEAVKAGGPPIHVVLLRDAHDTPRAARRVEAASEIIAGRARGITEVWSQGSGLLARLFSLILFGDLVSVYLAVLEGADPTSVEPIARIKARLREP
ncbi:MAG: bifunctional phosphoglucose/phosphomannose isomerase [Armatimonadota bacterium]|nr:bifunctional phosphoglucose/phosphomannose isomerase [Armatimonadota bacterium]